MSRSALNSQHSPQDVVSVTLDLLILKLGFPRYRGQLGAVVGFPRYRGQLGAVG